MTEPGSAAPQSKLKVLLTAEMLRKRIAELGKQISEDYKGRTVCVVGVLSTGFMFMSDLVRNLEGPVLCHFLTSSSSETGTMASEIRFEPEIDVRGHHVLLVEGLIQSGITSQFLMDHLVSRGAATVKLCALLDKQSGRRVELQPDYFGFLMNDSFVVGYGLGASHLGRNLPYVAVVGNPARA